MFVLTCLHSVYHATTNQSGGHFLSGSMNPSLHRSHGYLQYFRYIGISELILVEQLKCSAVFVANLSQGQIDLFAQLS